MPRITEHIEALNNKGLHSAIYEFKGKVDLNRLGRHFNMMVKRRHPDVGAYHFFWFRTKEGVYVSYVGNMFLLDAVDDFISKAVGIRIAVFANEIYSGRSKELFMGELLQRLRLYNPTPRTRSYGGAQLGEH